MTSAEEFVDVVNQPQSTALYRFVTSFSRCPVGLDEQQN